MIATIDIQEYLFLYLFAFLWEMIPSTTPPMGMIKHKRHTKIADIVEKTMRLSAVFNFDNNRTGSINSYYENNYSGQAHQK